MSHDIITHNNVSVIWQHTLTHTHILCFNEICAAIYQLTSIRLTAGYREMTNDVTADLARALGLRLSCARGMCVSSSRIFSPVLVRVFDVSQMMLMIRILLKMAATQRLTRVRVSPRGGARDTAACTPVPKKRHNTRGSRETVTPWSVRNR